MEGNRDEAEKCINIASKALEAGDKEKAAKFLNKAEKLYPTERAKGTVSIQRRPTSPLFQSADGLSEGLKGLRANCTFTVADRRATSSVNRVNVLRSINVYINTIPAIHACY